MKSPDFKTDLKLTCKKKENYEPLCKRLINITTTTRDVPIIAGALGTKPTYLEKLLNNPGGDEITTQPRQKASLLGTAYV